MNALAIARARLECAKIELAVTEQTCHAYAYCHCHHGPATRKIARIAVDLARNAYLSLRYGHISPI